HHGIDLGLEQNEIAHDHDTAMHWLERGPTAERERRSDGDAVQSHIKVGARKRVAVDVASYGGCACADRFIHLLPVDLLGVGGAADARQCTKCKHVNTTHCWTPFYLAGRPPVDRPLPLNLKIHATSPAKWSAIPTAEHASKVAIMP